MTMTTIKEFIHLNQRIYGLKAETYDKIKVKISRELSKIEEWTAIQEPKREGNGRNSSIILDDEVLKKLSKVMKPYFRKLANIPEKEIELLSARTNENYINKNQVFKQAIEPLGDPNHHRVPENAILSVMVKTLFNEKFVLDLESWEQDLSNWIMMEGDEDYIPDEEMVVLKYRLDNPQRFYVQKVINEKGSTE